METLRYRFKQRVYYEDTDCTGVVYHANYLKFMERARSQWLLDLGFSQTQSLSQSMAFVVHRIDIRYDRPAKLQDHLEVVTTLAKVSPASLTFMQEIFNDEQMLLTRAEVRVAYVTLPAFKPKPLPQNLLALINRRDH